MKLVQGTGWSHYLLFIAIDLTILEIFYCFPKGMATSHMLKTTFKIILFYMQFMEIYSEDIHCYQIK